MPTPPGRFSEPSLLVLVSLLDGPLHGYAMADDIERLTGARPGPGTLYGAVARLLSADLIVEAEPAGRRRPYRLTDAGRAQVQDELAAMSTLARVGTRRLRQRPTVRRLA